MLGRYTLTLTVSDDLAESAPMTTTVEVLPSLPPERMSVSPSCADAGGSLQISGFKYPQLDGLFQDDEPTASLLRDGWNFADGPLSLEPVEVVLSWQDEPLLLEPRLPDLLFQSSVSIPAGLTAGSYAIASSGLEPVSVSVPCPLDTNLPPVADAGGPSYTAATGVLLSLNGAGSSDPEGAAVTYHWDFGDGHHQQVDTPQLAHTFAYPGVYLVTLVVNDGQRDSTLGPGTRSYTLVTVTGEPPTSQPPTVSAGNDVPGDEGGAISLVAGASDPDNDLLTTMWSYTTGFGVDPGATCSFANVSASATTVICTDDGTYTVTLTADDGVNAPVGDSATVTVGNLAPVIGSVSGPVAPAHINSAVAISATYRDAGTTDSHTSNIDWGDGSTPTTGTATGGGITSTHAYTAPGVYIVTITVADDDTGSATELFQYVVVYDPSGGFVTGGGWITSPAGAYTADPAMTGKATFGFVSKYQKGATVPSGNTQFQFQAGNLNFTSTAYEWLVIAGPKAQYKGTGTINGTGSYGFLLTASDGQVTGGGGIDKFRIKIWDMATGTIVYDNQMGAADNAGATTALGGGSIVIHAKR